MQKGEVRDKQETGQVYQTNTTCIYCSLLGFSPDNLIEKKSAWKNQFKKIP